MAKMDSYNFNEGYVERSYVNWCLENPAMVMICVQTHNLAELDSIMCIYKIRLHEMKMFG